MNAQRNILGGIPGLFEEDFERETRETTVISSETGKFPSTGTIEFKEKEKVEIKRKEIFFRTLKEGQDKVQREKDKIFEEEISDIISNLPTEQKNRLLHYQASYKDKSIYQRSELRKKLIEEQQKTKKQEKTASIPNPAKKSYALETAFEGGSGTQGSGTANLSAQAVG